MTGPKVSFVFPKWKFKSGPMLEDVFLYRIKFKLFGEKRLAGVWYVRKDDSKGYDPPDKTGKLPLGTNLKPVMVGEDYFYVSLELLNDDSQEFKDITKTKCGGKKAKVKNEKDQTVEIPLDPFKKLPLGFPPESNADEYARPVGSTRWHKFYIPTKYGGYLHIGLSKGYGKLYYGDWQTRAQNAQGQNYKFIRQIRIMHIPPGKHGWYFLKAELYHRYGVTVKFWEEGIARDNAGEPHVPWNFYWFPVNKDEFFKPGSVLHKYDEAFENSKNPEEQDAKDYLQALHDKWEKAYNEYDADKIQEKKDRVTLALDNFEHPASAWEKEFHYNPNQPDWAGHCHNVAPASIYTKTPEAWNYNTKTFSQEDIGLLCAEMTGNYKKLKMDKGRYCQFTMDPGGTIRPPGSANTWAILYFFKPSETPSKQAFIQSVTSFLGNGAVGKEKQIEKTVEDTIKKYGGRESKFIEHVQREFGRYAARFHAFLQEWVNEKGFCGMANLRSVSDQDNCSPVWNHAFFNYTSIMEEEPGYNDEKRIRVTTVFYSNTDAGGVVGTIPATPYDSQFGFRKIARVQKRNRIGEGLYPPEIRELAYTIQYRADGTIDESSSHNSCEMVSNTNGDELYAPAYMILYQGFTPQRQKGDAFGLGNPFADMRPQKVGILSLVDKYK